MRKYLFFILILVTACSPQKRLTRLLKKHPELVKTLDTRVTVKDTLLHSDTFVYPGFTDSFSITGDTILKKGKFSLKKNKNNYSLQVYSDTFYSTDTIYYEKVFTVPGKVLEKSKSDIIWWVLLLAIVVSFCFYIKSMFTLHKHIKAVANRLL